MLGFVQSSLGWDLGVAESVAGIIIIGFSVDYTVHLGNEYIQGGREGYDDRISRVFYASRRIVSTVAAGAMTTGGAGLFMFPAQLVFFIKMAVLMLGTIVYSYLYALGFFMGALLIMGPEGELGDVKRVYEACMSWVTGVLSCDAQAATSGKEDQIEKKNKTFNKNAASGMSDSAGGLIELI